MSATLSTAHHDGAETGGGPFSEVLHASLRGAIAAAAMTGMRAFTVSLGLVEETPPRAIIDKAGVAHVIPRKKRRAAVEVLHWAYGAQGGALFGLLPDDLRRRPWSGPVYGMVLWLGFELVLAPLLGLKHAERKRPVERLAIAADHALYGFVLSEMRRRPQG
jgi:hypothetical protein